ncbi:MAG TPA: TolC family protein [Thermoanaerobaculia bacterium]
MRFRLPALIVIAGAIAAIPGPVTAGEAVRSAGPTLTSASLLRRPVQIPETPQLPDGTLDLRAAIAEALAANPAIAGADARLAGADARLLEARSMWLPRAGVTETIMRSDNPVFVFGSLLEQGNFGQQNFDPAFLNDPNPHTNFRLALNVQYTVFDQFRRLNMNRKAHNGVTQAGLAGDDARRRLRAEVISRFYGILVADQRRDVAAEAVGAAEADVSAMRDRFEQGLIVRADLLGAEVQLATFRQNLIEAESQAAIARAALATLIRRPISQSLTPRGSIPDSLPAELTLESAIDRGLAARADVRIADSAAENATLDLKTAHGSLLPRLDTFASWGSSSDRLTGGDPDRAIGVVIGFDLFDGARYARIAQSRAGLLAARADAAAARDAATMEIVSAWHRTNSARSRLAVAAASVSSAEEAARIVRDRYENGLTFITDHLRAQTALLGARLELITARYDYAVGYAELMRTTGGLDDVDAFD